MYIDKILINNILSRIACFHNYIRPSDYLKISYIVHAMNRFNLELSGAEIDNLIYQAIEQINYH